MNHNELSTSQKNSSHIYTESIFSYTHELSQLQYHYPKSLHMNQIWIIPWIKYESNMNNYGLQSNNQIINNQFKSLHNQIWITVSLSQCLSPDLSRLQEAFTSFRQSLQTAARNLSATAVARAVAKAQLQRQRHWTKADRRGRAVAIAHGLIVNDGVYINCIYIYIHMAASQNVRSG